MVLIQNSNISLSFSNYFLSFLYVFHLRHSRDGADSLIFTISLSFSRYLLSLSILSPCVTTNEDVSTFIIYLLRLQCILMFDTKNKYYISQFYNVFLGWYIYLIFFKLIYSIKFWKIFEKKLCPHITESSSIDDFIR